MNRITKVLADTTSKVLFRAAEVTSVTEYGSRFRSIELTGDALEKPTWKAGDKLQIRADPDSFTNRTYTPISWDNARGSTVLLAYAHGTGPGSAWVKDAAVGQTCQVFGPRGSLKLDDLPGPPLFVGDETSFALARAWEGRNPGAQPIAELFEVTDPDESRLVVDAIGLSAARLLPRRDGAAHLQELSGSVADLLRTHPDAFLCLTGRAQTIAVIRHNLKTAGYAGRTTRVKAYWDENRAGLD